MPFGEHETWYRVTGELRSGATPLVVVHGGPGSTHDYLLALADLAGPDRPVVHYDQIGNGGSTHLPDRGPEFWTVRLFLDELDNLLDRLGIADDYALFGHSWGGMLAVEHAASRPAGLRGLVVANAPASYPLWLQEMKVLRGALPPGVDATLRCHEDAGTTGSEEYHAALRVFYEKHVCRLDPWPRDYMASFYEIYDDPTVYFTMNGPSEFHVIGSLRDWGVVNRCADVAVPTLLLSGRHDEATPVTVRPFQELIPDVHWEIFEESSHLPHLEEPERFAEVLGAYLDGLRSPRAGDRSGSCRGAGVPRARSRPTHPTREAPRMDSGGDASAMVFPGMGPVPFAEAARFLLVNPVARRMTAEASEVLGYPLIDRWREADGDYSEYAQVAFLVGCLALAEWAREEHGVDARVCAGPSFGGKAAAVHTGALPFADGVLMTARWARFLEDFSAGEHGHVVTQSFARVPAGELARITAELADRGAWHEVSCEVDEDFHMLSLGRDELDWLGKRIRAAGGLPLYTMYPPMHVSLFGPLRGRIESEVLGGLRFADPALPLIADQDGRAVDTGEEVRTMLADGFERPVRWPRVVAALRRHGVGTLYVCGHDALFGRVPVTRRNFTVVPADPRTALRPRRRGPAPSR
ncbi:hypothetical protein GCM10010376_88700 [Streptomyces violaceusniger]